MDEQRVSWPHSSSHKEGRKRGGVGGSSFASKGGGKPPIICVGYSSSIQTFVTTISGMSRDICMLLILTGEKGGQMI